MANAILLTINLSADMASYERRSEPTLVQEFCTLIEQTDEELDELFRMTCRRVALGYAWLQNALRRSGRRTFKPAMRRFPAYQSLTAETKTRIETDIRYIRCIYENWQLIVRNCTLPIMSDLDVRSFPLWKLAKCRNLGFVENENNKVNAVRRRPTQRAYSLTMIYDIVDNKTRSTETLLSLVGNDQEQIKKISEDFHDVLQRRANGFL